MPEQDFLNAGLSQKLYDNFNDFIFSEDSKVVAKLLWRTYFILETRHVPGDIAECGVFKGSGLISWLKILRTFCPGAYKKVIGFDFFDTKAILNTLSGEELENMTALFKSRHVDMTGDFICLLVNQLERAGFKNKNYELVKGDISVTSKRYVEERPGAKFSIIYLDCDLAEPTYNALVNFWDRLSVGGYVVFDEYAYHQWTESQGADRFAKEYGLQIGAINAECPTAYIRKPLNNY